MLCLSSIYMQYNSRAHRRVFMQDNDGNSILCRFARDVKVDAKMSIPKDRYSHMQMVELG